MPAGQAGDRRRLQPDGGAVLAAFILLAFILLFRGWGAPQLTSNTMAFQQARLSLPSNTAKRLIRAGLALGLERKAREGGCGAGAEKRRTAPQLPGGPCMGPCGLATASRWYYGGKEHGGKQVCGSCYTSHAVRLVKGVRVR